MTGSHSFPKLNHVAIATHEPAKLRKVFELIGLKYSGEEDVPSQGVKTHFLKAESYESAMELLEPINPEGVIAKFIAKKGPGIHHISFEVDDIVALSRTLTDNQIKLIYKEPQPGAHHMLVNFIHPESTGGVLIEISEKKI